jgi:hypothetical protein
MNGKPTTARAGHYRPTANRPDLCQQAAADLGLTNVKARRFPEGELVSGYRNGQHRLYHRSRYGNWERID